MTLSFIGRELINEFCTAPCYGERFSKVSKTTPFHESGHENLMDRQTDGRHRSDGRRDNILRFSTGIPKLQLKRRHYLIVHSVAYIRNYECVTIKCANKLFPPKPQFFMLEILSVFTVSRYQNISQNAVDRIPKCGLNS